MSDSFWLTQIDRHSEVEDKSRGRLLLESWLNKPMKVEMTDGRILVGVFLCTDKDRNVILGATNEYVKSPGNDRPDTSKEGRNLGLAMIPGHCIVSISIDADCLPKVTCSDKTSVSLLSKSS